jgi:hypothetical protein
MPKKYQLKHAYMSSKKVKFKWPQLVGDRLRHMQKAHNDTQNNHINSEYTLK